MIAGGEDTALEWIRNLVSNWIRATTPCTGPESSVTSGLKADGRVSRRTMVAAI
jgi:hypothetical protein